MGFKVISKRKPAEQIIAQLSKSKCPKCGSNVIIPTKKVDEHKNRVYKCLKCNALIAAPTEWSWCELKGRIARDLFLHDCLLCDKYKAGEKCPYYLEKIKHEEV